MMIEKLELIAKLLQDKKISTLEAATLLETEKEYIYYPNYINPIVYPQPYIFPNSPTYISNGVLTVDPTNITNVTYTTKTNN